MSIDRIGFGTFTPPVQRREQAGKTGRTGRGAPSGFERAFGSKKAQAKADSVGPSAAGEPVKFSRHAQARLQSRGIELSDQDMNDLSEAVDKLDRKGARESLMLHGDNAFIVGIPKRTVITAMTRHEAVGSIFTNIDSTIVVR